MEKNHNRVIITQSNYIPWKGYFDAINLADVFVIYDDMQYTKRDWRNRNKIKTKQGLRWITIPVEVSGKYYQKINETKIADKNWGIDHWNTLYDAYRESKYFDEYRSIFEEFYRATKEEMLTKVNQQLIELVCNILGIKTRIIRSEEFLLLEDRSERLADICARLGATDYYTGPAAKAYMSEEPFTKLGISVHYLNYENYLEYDQLYPPFEHGVSILDLIFNEGVHAVKYMKSFK